MNSEISEQSITALIRNFELDTSSTQNEISSANPFEKIRQLLIDKISYLLDHNFEKLLQILYRIDVSEEKAKAALAAFSGNNPAEMLTDLIIERQIQKAKSRIQHRDEEDGE